MPEARILWLHSDGGSLGPAQSEVEAALLRVAQGRDLPGAVVAAQRDDPRFKWNRSPTEHLGPEQDWRGADPRGCGGRAAGAPLHSRCVWEICSWERCSAR